MGSTLPAQAAAAGRTPQREGLPAQALPPSPEATPNRGRAGASTVPGPCADKEAVITAWIDCCFSPLHGLGRTSSSLIQEGEGQENMLDSAHSDPTINGLLSGALGRENVCRPNVKFVISAPGGPVGPPHGPHGHRQQA